MVLSLLDMYGLNSLFSRQKFFAPHGGRPRLSAGAEPLPHPSVQTRVGVTHLFVELSPLESFDIILEHMIRPRIISGHGISGPNDGCAASG